jgi:hypothetical protein
MSSLVAGAEMMTFLTVEPRCALALVGVGEEAGGFDDDLRADGGPVELGGVALGEDLDLLAVDDDEVVALGDLVLQVAEDGVVLEQVGQGGGGGEVVDGDEFDVGIAEGGAEDVASDAAEAVDANLNCHVRRPPVLSLRSSSHCSVIVVRGEIAQNEEEWSADSLSAGTWEQRCRDLRRRLSEHPVITNPCASCANG